MKIQLTRLMAASAFALVASSAAAVDITYRHFSYADSMGPPADVYSNSVAAITTQTLGEDKVVKFTKLPGVPKIPAQFGGDLVKSVAAGVAGGGFDAAYTSGSELNKAWGFIYNSGVPFGPGFEEFLGFLFGQSVNGNQTGLELLQSILDKNNANIVAFPIVGNAEQVSGYFALPVGDAPDGTKGIGIAGLCQQPWRFRYLTPGENVLTQTCNDLVAAGVIPAKNISFIQAIPGGGSLVDAVKLGQLEAFEFATPYDDVSQLFMGVDNPGTVGLRYAHFPGWQQQFLVTWMLVNKQVWDGLTPAQKTLLQVVGRENLISSYGHNMQKQGPALRYILDVNRGDGIPGNDLQLVEWPKKDQALMRAGTLKFLNGRAIDPAFSAQDRADYVTILEAFRKYVGSGDLYWDPKAVKERSRFTGWENLAGEPWTEKVKYE